MGNWDSITRAGQETGFRRARRKISFFRNFCFLSFSFSFSFSLFLAATLLSLSSANPSPESLQSFEQKPSMITFTSLIRLQFRPGCVSSSDILAISIKNIPRLNTHQSPSHFVPQESKSNKNFLPGMRI